MPDRTRLVLASKSAARKAMLMAAGLTFEAMPAEVDEDGIASAMEHGGGSVEAADIANALAAEKARSVSLSLPGALVIGSDQVLMCGRRRLSKATTREEARQTLEVLRGRDHELVSSVALAEDGNVVWQVVESAQLTMWAFSDAFLDSYLERAGDSILGSVGCYEIEGPGVQLFEKIEGDVFTILGMPMLPLLAELRRRGVIAV